MERLDAGAFSLIRSRTIEIAYDARFFIEITYRTIAAPLK
jgi:hypothetical protein